MRLTRNTTLNGHGKYAIVRLDKIRNSNPLKIADFEHLLSMLERERVLEYGEKGSEEEFFVIKLKDKNAAEALYAYSKTAFQNGDRELAFDMVELARRSETHPNRKRPD